MYIYIYVYITTYTCVCICRSKYWSRASVSPRWRSTRSRWPQVASTCATESEIVSTATALRSGLMCCTVVRINGKIHYKWEYGCVWKCCVSLNPMVLLIIIPFLNGYFIGNIPYFQTNPYVRIFQPAWIKIIFDKVKALETLDETLCTFATCATLFTWHSDQFLNCPLRLWGAAEKCDWRNVEERCLAAWQTVCWKHLKIANIWTPCWDEGWITNFQHHFRASELASPSHAGMCCARLCRLQHLQFYAIGHGEIQVSEPGGDRKN